MNKIAVLTDSGTDVPQEYVDRYGMYVLPLTINYKERSYRDRVDISSAQVLERLDEEIPSTSLPSIGETLELMQKIYNDGVRELIIVTISSGLSGTNNMLRLVAGEFEGMNIRLFDTRNISIGAGIFAIRAAELAEEGLGIDEIVKKLHSLINNTRVFFCVDSLKYLQKGGRIGLVTATVGSILGIKPVISCNDEGIYCTVKKARGMKAAADAAVAELIKATGSRRNIRLMAAHAGAEELLERVTAELRKSYGREVLTGTISPALCVHTGPGLIGVGVQFE